jgi:hypothetical protein
MKRKLDTMKLAAESSMMAPAIIDIKGLAFLHESSYKWIASNIGQKFMVYLTPWDPSDEKLLMYAYYYASVLESARIGFRRQGYHGMDKDKCDNELKLMFASYKYMTPKGERIGMLDKRRMSKPRLHQFIEDCILFIEQDLETQVITVEEFKQKNPSKYGPDSDQ